MRINYFCQKALIDRVLNQFELATFYHFQKTRSICTPDQQKKIDEVIDDALRMMAPKPPGPPGR